MKKRMKKVLAALSLAFLGSGLAIAAPLTMNIQGVLTDPNGNPYVTQQTVEFKVYQGGKPATAGSGVLAYDETATVTPSASGVINYLLGNGTPNGATLPSGQPNVMSTATFDTAQTVFLELWVAGNVTLPRLQMAAVPSAVVALVAENLKSGSVINTTGLNAQWVTISSTDNTKPSLTTSGGIVSGGAITAPSFQGVASSVPAAGILPGTLGAGVNVPLGNLQGGTLGSGVLVPIGNLTGGTLNQTNLPSNLAYTSSTNTFTVPQTFAATGTAVTVQNNMNTGSLTITQSAAASPQANTLTKEAIGRAWVNFDGSTASCPTVGSQCTIRSGFNVASVTRASTGSYTVAWKTPFADTFYVLGGSCERTDTNATIAFQTIHGSAASPYTATTALIGCGNYDGYLTDAAIVGVQAMGNQ